MPLWWEIGRGGASAGPRACPGRWLGTPSEPGLRESTRIARPECETGRGWGQGVAWEMIHDIADKCDARSAPRPPAHASAARRANWCNPGAPNHAEGQTNGRMCGQKTSQMTGQMKSCNALASGRTRAGTRSCGGSRGGTCCARIGSRIFSRGAAAAHHSRAHCEGWNESCDRRSRGEKLGWGGGGGGGEGGSQ